MCFHRRFFGEAGGGKEWKDKKTQLHFSGTTVVGRPATDLLGVCLTLLLLYRPPPGLIWLGQTGRRIGYGGTGTDSARVHQSPPPSPGFFPSHRIIHSHRFTDGKASPRLSSLCLTEKKELYHRRALLRGEKLFQNNRLKSLSHSPPSSTSRRRCSEWVIKVTTLWTRLSTPISSRSVEGEKIF